MSYETRTYDDVFGEPVVVLVVKGGHDVSRLQHTLGGGPAVGEQLQLAEQLARQLQRHNGGRAALQLLARHGGRDFTDRPLTVAEPSAEDYDNAFLDMNLALGGNAEIRIASYRYGAYIGLRLAVEGGGLRPDHLAAARMAEALVRYEREGGPPEATPAG